MNPHADDRQNTIAALRKALLEQSAGVPNSRVGTPADCGPEAGSQEHRFVDDPTARKALSRAQAIVLRQLAARPRSRSELSRALASREVDEEIAEQALNIAERTGLIDDCEYAELVVRQQRRDRGLSRSSLRRELAKRGVAEEIALQALADIDPSEDLAKAEELASRRLKTLNGLTREVQYRRLASYLARRGYSVTTVARTLENLLGGG